MRFALLILVIAFLPVNIADASVPRGGLQRFAKDACVCQGVLHDRSVSIEAQVDQVVVLSDDLRTGPREIQRIRFLGSSKVMQLELQVLGQVFLIAPDDPTHAGKYESKFVPGNIDRFDAVDVNQ